MHTHLAYCALQHFTEWMLNEMKSAETKKYRNRSWLVPLDNPALAAMLMHASLVVITSSACHHFISTMGHGQAW
jgi:hypothetical protein